LKLNFDGSKTTIDVPNAEIDKVPQDLLTLEGKISFKTKNVSYANDGKERLIVFNKGSDSELTIKIKKNGNEFEYYAVSTDKKFDIFLGTRGELKTHNFEECIKELKDKFNETLATNKNQQNVLIKTLETNATKLSDEVEKIKELIEDYDSELINLGQQLNQMVNLLKQGNISP
jgi:hypothetical protein